MNTLTRLTLITIYSTAVLFLNSELAEASENRGHTPLKKLTSAQCAKKGGKIASAAYEYYDPDSESLKKSGGCKGKTLGRVTDVRCKCVCCEGDSDGRSPASTGGHVWGGGS